MLCTVTLQWSHNHDIMTAQALRYHAAGQDIKDTFKAYFDEGMNPAAAMPFHRDFVWRWMYCLQNKTWQTVVKLLCHVLYITGMISGGSSIWVTNHCLLLDCCLLLCDARLCMQEAMKKRIDIRLLTNFSQTVTTKNLVVKRQRIY